MAPKLPEAACDDSHDDKFLACAITSRTPVIVSGDKHLLNVSGYQGISVLSPRKFVDKIFVHFPLDSNRRS